MNRIIQGLWIGPGLSILERLSISSFLKNGHDYHLYTYDHVEGVPEGTTLLDGNQILPESEIFQYKNNPSYAAFSNYFRYKLLLEKGGWWADTDTICLKPFDFAEAHVFATEWHEGQETITSGVIKAPEGSPVMGYAWETCKGYDKETLEWGVAGPKLMGEAVRHHKLEALVKPPVVFCPIAYPEFRKVLVSLPDFQFEEATYGIHFWNAMFTWYKQDKEATYPADSIYEKLKTAYL